MKNQYRFFLKPEAFARARVRFPRDVSRQLRNVLRLKAGDRVMALDGTGRELEVQLEAMGREIEGSVLAERRNSAEPAVCIVLYQGLLKGAKLELVLQKCTEIGVSEFIPLKTARSVGGEPSASRRRRLEAILKEAAEQSGRGKIPTLGEAVGFEEGLARAVREGPAFFAWEEEEALAVRDVALVGAETVSLFIGPEGGFMADEAATAQEAGAQVVTLGPRTLRSETAAILASSLLLDRLDAALPNPRP